jgi:hypothetical protein
MEYGNKFCGKESAEGDVPANALATSIIKVSCVLFIGIVIISGVFTASNITASSAFYSAYKTVTDNVTSGYTLVSLMIMVIGAGSILYFLGFI